MTTDEVRVTLRLPPGLHRHITELAAYNRRSRNSQILWLLEHGVIEAESQREKDAEPTDDELADRYFQQLEDERRGK